MNIQEAKNIRLVDFLAGFGHESVIQHGRMVQIALQDGKGGLFQGRPS